MTLYKDNPEACAKLGGRWISGRCSDDPDCGRCVYPGQGALSGLGPSGMEGLAAVVGAMFLAAAGAGAYLSYRLSGRRVAYAVGGAVAAPVALHFGLRWRAKYRGEQAHACFQAWCDANPASCKRSGPGAQWYSNPQVAPASQTAFDRCYR